MLRVERAAGELSIVTRLARPRAVVVLAGLLLAIALAVRARSPLAAVALAAGAAVVLAVAGRAVRVRFRPGARVTVRAALPFGRDVNRALADFAGVRVETVAEARARRADRLAHGYRARSGGQEMPGWLRPRPTAGLNDQLRRVVLVPVRGEPLAVTAWLPAGEDVDGALREVEAVLR